jgi:glycosyltransferase involved in cell wall biosynthesis
MSAGEIRISVVIPVYNCAEYVGEAVDSVLIQTFPPLEVIIIDSSTDGTSDIIEEFKPRVRHFRQTKAGIGAARNLGVRESAGSHIAHLDADDVWHRDKLKLQAAAFAADPELDIAGAYMEAFYSPDLTQEERGNLYRPPDPLPGFSASALVVGREPFFRVGYYETHWKVGQDLSWFIRARESGLKEHMIPEVLVRRRLHKSNTDLMNQSFGRERLLILRESICRKKNGPVGEKSENHET